MTIPSALLIAALLLPVQIAIVPGDPGNGAALFADKGCIQCHSFNGRGGSVAPDLARQSDESHSPSRLAAELWNHIPMMWAKLKDADRGMPLMSSVDTADLFAYFYSLESRAGNPRNGLNIFERDCETCHSFGSPSTGKKIDLLDKRAPRTLSGYAAAVTNHTGARLRKLEEHDMNDLTSYLFLQRYLAESGDAARGAQVYIDKGCASCHDTKPLGKNAPDLPQFTERFSPVTITAALWRSGPAMLNAMQQKKMQWPEFHGSEMADLIAYLNQRLINRIGTR
jgi:mono/diheme cytochrome c family protein